MPEHPSPRRVSAGGCATVLVAGMALLSLAGCLASLSAAMQRAYPPDPYFLGLRSVEGLLWLTAAATTLLVSRRSWRHTRVITALATVVALLFVFLLNMLELEIVDRSMPPGG